MMILTIVIPILLLLLLLTIIMMTKNIGRMRMKKSFHFKLIIGYLVLLIIVLIVAETMEQKVENASLPKTVISETEFDLYHAIVEDLPIPESSILAKRSHEIEGKFSIPSFVGAYILIERTSESSQTIEETIYAPELMASFGDNDIYYDLSDQIEIKMPIWNEHSMSVPKQPQNQLHYTFYHDSNILNQFTGERTSDYGSSSGSVSGTMTIHLLIPESIELDIPEAENQQGGYIDILE